MCRQISLPDAIYLIDVVAGGAALVSSCAAMLECRDVLKVIHDSKRDSEVRHEGTAECRGPPTAAHSSSVAHRDRRMQSRDERIDECEFGGEFGVWV